MRNALTKTTRKEKSTVNDTVSFCICICFCSIQLNNHTYTGRRHVIRVMTSERCPCVAFAFTETAGTTLHRPFRRPSELRPQRPVPGHAFFARFFFLLPIVFALLLW